MTIPEILLIMVIHWLADFCLQTDEQARNKWHSMGALTGHVAVYSIVWFIASYGIFGSWEKAAAFTVATFICHFMIDLITSVITHNHFDKKDYHNGFVTVGFDQILHHMQLFLTFVWLKSLV